MPSPIRVTDFSRIVFFTGAGMSAESGVPTYRGKGGIWKEYDFESCACQEAFERDPDHVWEFHNYRRGLVRKCEPNEGHRLIARCEQVLPSVTVVTQNIDGLHQRAGSKRVHELHGSLWKLRCDRCGWRDEDFSAPVDDLLCPACKALAATTPRGTPVYKRPGIVWFGDSLSGSVVQASCQALDASDLMISIGTSAVVFPAAQLPVVAKRAGATLVEINPEDTPMSELYDHCMRSTATEALTELCQGLPSGS
ncbi:SIR2 family NAD-dependent protein deacylase [Paraliomyxa miuraensis]|uniref:SIR2 family NAD-dependent protein deacylase n=1 Tax=Paraliomyxa miuraensis TaxID=376150 RepID=UPI002255D219|nr:NAD-dependent deacylase [Paraliomyxa miuraensis]MCX4243489.1 NAD-dependent deacylase [Paraliomyxa miuraensis]